jgi:hypothetical protein
MAGAAGLAGPAGPAGVRCPTGPMGAQGPTGAVLSWSSYRDVMFDGNQADIRSAEMIKVSEIATT